MSGIIFEFFISHILWCLLEMLILTAMTRAFIKFFGKPFEKKHEVAFWVILLVGGTLALLVFEFDILDHAPESKHIGFQASVLGAGPSAEGRAILVTNLSEFPKSGAGGASNSTPPDANGFSFQMVLRVVNAGESSVAWNWKAYIILPNSKEKIEALIPFYVSCDGTMTTPFGPIQITTENNLVQSLVTTELPRGRAAIGWVGLHVNGIKSVPWGTRFVITFEDAFKHETRVEHVWDPPLKTDANK